MRRVQWLVCLDEQEAIGAAHRDTLVMIDSLRLNMENNVVHALVQLPAGQLHRETQSESCPELPLV